MINQAFILVGGRGSRLGKITKKNPKPLLKIDGLPFLDYLIEYFIKFKFKKIILLTSYKHEKFIKMYNNKKIKNTNIKCFREEKFLGTSGALKKSLSKAQKQFILCNGDTFFDINLFDLINRFNKNLIGALAYSSKQKIDKRYTNINHNNKKITSSGVYLFNKEKIKKYLISPGSLENFVVRKLPKKKFKNIVYEKNFIDIGIPQDLKKAQVFLDKTRTKKCVFLDRDGVINYDLGYVHNKFKFFWKKKVIEAIKYLNDNNYYVIVISNQAGVGKGYYKQSHVDKLHEWMDKELNNKGAYIDKYYYATFYKHSKIKKFRTGSYYRKPNIGMFKKAFKEFKIIKNKSYFIGDKITDELAAKKFKIKYFNGDNKTNLYNLIKKKIITQ